MSAAGTELVRGQLVLAAAAPGAGKSAVILTWALKSRVPAFYVSADSDAHVQLSRAVSIETGWTLAESSDAVRSGDLGDAEAKLAGIPIRFDYAASPTPDQIESRLDSYGEVYGDFPELIVVDNVTNVVGLSQQEEDPFSGLESLMDYLATMARGTEACVVGLHHVTGAYNDGNTPIPLSGLKGQIGRVPAMVLTLHKEITLDETFLHVSTVKNRNGKADSTGLSSVPLRFIGERMQIHDLEHDNIFEENQ